MILMAALDNFLPCTGNQRNRTLESAKDLVRTTAAFADLSPYLATLWVILKGSRVTPAFRLSHRCSSLLYEVTLKPTP